MATGNIKQVKLGSDSYELLAKYIQDGSGNGKTWADIEALAAAAKMKIIVVTTLPTASAATLGAIYLVAETGSTGTYVEYITVENPSGTYNWERIGTTQADLSGYVKKGTYTGKALTSGSHTHTVSGSTTVPTISRTTKNLKATASGTAVGANGTAAAITGFGTHTTDKALGVDTTFTVTGGVASTTNIKATASGTDLNTGNADFVKSYPGVTSKLVMGSVTGVDGTANVPSSVSVTNGSPASWGATVTSGVLEFSWTANTPTAVAVGTNVTVAKKAASATNIVTGISTDGTGATVLTGLGTATTGKALTSASVKTQPTIALATGATAGAGVISVATGVSAIGLTVGTDDQVDAITALGTPTTANALTGVKVTAQPTIALTNGATAGTGVVSVATGVSAIGLTVGTDDQVDAITALGTPTTANALTGVKVTAQPTIALDGNAASGVAYVDTVTIGSTSAALSNGTAAANGDHVHKLDLTGEPDAT